MTDPFTLPSKEGLDAAERALARGELVVFPTDTVYGLAARPDLAGATDRIFEAKRRPRSLTLPVLAADFDQARTVAVFDDRAERLAARLWPGALTVVLPRTRHSAGWDLGEATETVGVRVPRHAEALELLRRTGPLAVTSANPSGERPEVTCEGVRAGLGHGVSVYLCAPHPLRDRPSTVVDLTQGEMTVIRAGMLSEQEVVAALSR